MRVLAKLVDRRRHWRFLAIALLYAAFGLVHAQSNGDDGADPPSRVARLSYISGDLGFQPAGATRWTDASVNRPLTTGDRLSTGHDSRAELELGGGTLRIAGQTNFALLDLNQQLAQVELTQGTLNLTVRQLESGQSYEIDTPTVALVVDQPGTFRVDIDGDGSTQVTAFDSDAIVYGENSAQRTVRPGRSYHFVDSSLAAVAVSEIGGGDAFDSWSGQRNRRYAASTTRRYVSDDVVGYQDLDQYGDWQETNNYGAVWYPSHVDTNWAPYRDGHWAYIAPWGWTWVDDSPWGYAPYHYGRWAYTQRGWGWIPGPRDAVAVYAPALVAFVGGGGWSVGIGIGSGPVGWFPLGPGEIYNPWYHCDRDYYTNVNVTNIRVTNITNQTTIINNVNNHYGNYRDNRPVSDERYANRNAPRGFTAVPGRTLADGRHVQRDLLRVDPRKLESAPVSPHGIALRPVAGAAAAVRSPYARSLPAEGFRRDVVARHAPPALARPSAVGNPDAARRVAVQPSNVRLLNPRGARLDAGGSRFDRGGNDRVMPDRRALPAVARITPAHDLAPASDAVARRLPAMGRDIPTEPRRGELPSARFAHRPAAGLLPGRDVEQPVRMPAQDSRAAMPRPGLSVISRANQNDARLNQRGLPQVAPIRQSMPAERTLPASRPMPASDQRFQRDEAIRTMRNNEPMTVRRSAEPRVDNFAREPYRAQPRPTPTPMRAEPARQAFQQPQYQPQQRAEPPRQAFQQPQYQPQQRAEPQRQAFQQPQYQPQQRAEPQRQAFQQPQYQPQQRAEPQRQAFQQPQYQPQQRAEPQQRVMSPSPQRNAATPAQKSVPRVRDKADQH
jgi:hypothetical protein